MLQVIGRIAIGLVASLALLNLDVAAQDRPVYIGLDAEFGHSTSTSPEAIKRGILIAIEEINQKGGVLDGRPLALQTRDNRSVPARAQANIKELAANPDLVAIFAGKFSPVVLDNIQLIHEIGIPLLDPWAAANGIVDNEQKPNYVFRLSLRDDWALHEMMSYAAKRGIKQVGLLLPNTAWGRSSIKSAEAYVDKFHTPIISRSAWYNWGEKSMLPAYNDLKTSGAKAIILVANETEGSLLVREMAAFPPAERMPIISHWGMTGGNFYELASPAIKDIDFSVVQTYSFIDANDANAKRVLDAAKRLFGVADARQLASPVGVAHAYDLTHILAKAINLAGSTDRKKIRNALERVQNYHGLNKNFRQPFTPSRHEALSQEDVFMARYDTDGAIVRIKRP